MFSSAKSQVGASLIRKARRADIDALTYLLERTWHESYRGVLPGAVLRMGLTTRFRTIIEGLFDDDCVTVLVAERNGSFIGMCACAPYRSAYNPALPHAESTNGCGEIFRLYVDPASQLGGIGTLLLNAADEILERAGFTDTIVWTYEDNLRARIFFESRGGIEIGKGEGMTFGRVRVSEVCYRIPRRVAAVAV